MKKLAAFTLTAAMIASLAGCSSSETPETTAAGEENTAAGSGETQGAEASGEWDFSGITLNLAHSTT